MDIYKITKAKITQTLAKTNGLPSGGAMNRLRCGGLSLEQEKLFSSKSEWSIAIGTDIAIIPTLFYVKPKHQGKNNQNSLKLRELNAKESELFPEVCCNFDSTKNIFDVVEHYCPDWNVTHSPKDRKSISKEFELDFIMIEDKYSKRGLLVILDPSKKFQLNTLTINRSVSSSVLLESINRHLSCLQIFQNVKVFLKKWKVYSEKSTVEKDIEQKRDDLERLGFECYFKSTGVDAPASKLTIKKDSKTVEFNIDIELKHDAKRFFNNREASNIKKYPRVPLLILANLDTSSETPEQKLLHPTISIDSLLTTLQLNLTSALPLLNSAKEELERLNNIVNKEAEDITKIKRKERKSKRAKKLG